MKLKRRLVSVKNQSLDLMKKKEKPIPEPRLIFVSCFHNDTKEGGIFILNNDLLDPIFEETGCFGLFYEQKHNVLFAITRKNPQIVSFKIEKDLQCIRIPVKFENYVFGNDAHGLTIYNNKLYLTASNGDENAEKAINDDGPGKFVGKIIISDIEYKKDLILIKNSRIHNPFNCNHHHHINDVLCFDKKIYLSSFTYCDPKKNYIKKGTITRLNFKNGPNILFEGLNDPHSLITFRDRMFICSSSSAQILSFNPNYKDIKLEYKGLDAFLRGILVTDRYLYFGVSYGIGRTDSKITNPIRGVFRFDRNTAETIKISVPDFCNNIYAIEGAI